MPPEPVTARPVKHALLERADQCGQVRRERVQLDLLNIAVRQLRRALGVHAVVAQQLGDVCIDLRADDIQPGPERRREQIGFARHQRVAADLLMAEQDEVSHHRHRNTAVVAFDNLAGVEQARAAGRQQAELVIRVALLVAVVRPDNRSLLVVAQIGHDVDDRVVGRQLLSRAIGRQQPPRHLGVGDAGEISLDPHAFQVLDPLFEVPRPVHAAQH